MVNIGTVALEDPKPIYIGEAYLCAEVAKWAVAQSPYACPSALNIVLQKLRAYCSGWRAEERDFPEMMKFVDSEEFEEWLSITLRSIPEYEAWNQPKVGSGGGFLIVTRYSVTPPDRDFIDLDALERNVVRGVELDRDQG